MVFSSLTFLLLFFPVVLLLYYAVPKQCKNGILFLFSLLFYAWGEPVYVGLMVFSTIVDYCCGRVVDKYRGTAKAKAGLLVSVLVNLGLLSLFKYSDFLLGAVNTVLGTSLPLLHLPLPIGISFYTFQTMSYTIDVYRNDAKVQKNIISFGAYVSLFPQLIAGPIVRYQTIADQLDSRRHTPDLFADGIRRFICGLGKKVLLANNIGLLWDTISKMEPGQLNMLSAWIGIIAFGFQIYFDFSGYSDMAIGLGKMFGFQFLENFNYPYISKSVTEFWRRWHISLGSWFRDYVYIPLGGNKRGLAIQLRNIGIIWLLTGFWHGANWNYVVWGLYFGLLLILEKFVLLNKLERIPAALSHIYTLLCVTFSWVLFAFENFKMGFAYLKTLFGMNGFCSQDTLYQLISYAPLLLLCVLASTPLASRLYHRLNAKWNEAALCTLDLVGMASILLLSVAYLISGSYNPFLYFRF